jgi:hypothetical protein
MLLRLVGMELGGMELGGMELGGMGTLLTASKLAFGMNIGVCHVSA